MLLKPLPAVQEALRAAGIIKRSEVKSLSRFQEHLESAGASLEDTANTISSIMRCGESDAVRLRAAEMTLRVHGIIQELEAEGPQTPQVNITIVSSNQNILNLIMPNL